MLKQSLFAALAAIAVILPLAAPADDTDIYINPRPIPGSEPLVMISLDYRSNLGSTVCSDVSSGCAAAAYFLTTSVKDDVPTSGKLVFFDVLKLAMKLVLSEISGLKLGLMLNHDQNNNCAGPQVAMLEPDSFEQHSPTSVAYSVGGWMLPRSVHMQKGGGGSGNDDDGDGIKNNKDDCPSTPSGDPVDGSGCSLADRDGDGVSNDVDNCIDTPNPGQEDTDSDGLGNACDATPGTPPDDTDPNPPAAGNFCSNGGYIARGFRTMQPSDADGATAEFLEILNAIPTPQGNLSHSYQGKELFFEFYRYLTGQGIFNGHNGGTDYATDSDFNLDVDGPAYDWDARIENATNDTYLSPLDGVSACSTIYTVNIMFQVSNQEADSDGAIAAARASGGMGFDPGNNNAAFSRVLGFLNDADLADGSFGTVGDIDGIQNVTSYFLILDKFINNVTTEYAKQGGTERPLAISEDDVEGLVNNLRSIFSQILSVSTTFVASSVPVNVFNRASVVDNVYIALFQAFETPEWDGNVKKLRLKEVELADGTQDFILVDALNDLANKNDLSSAVAGDGRIRLDALTYWTDISAGLLDNTDLDGDGNPDNGVTANRDGRHVARGAAGQQIPSFIADAPELTNADGQRQLFYDNGSNLAALDATAAVASVLQGSLGTVTAADTLDLLKYIRGVDVDDSDLDGSVSDARPWVMGDPLHSRPLPMNFGAIGSYTNDNPGIYIAVGSNDGFMRLIRNTTTASEESGREVWAFMPQSVMGIQPDLRANTTLSKPDLHPYGVDGEPSAYMFDKDLDGTIEAASGEFAYLYFGLRRGGSAYYAMDVTAPESPKLLWKIDNSMADFAELGLTFSKPIPVDLQVGANADGTAITKPGVIFAGGYDENKDATGLGTNDSVGNALYVVDAKTGALIWKAKFGAAISSSTQVFTHPALTDSIPSNVSAVDTDGNGAVDRVLVGDSGGRVLRADIGDVDTKNWKLSVLASFGRHVDATKSNDRRFFHEPDIVQFKDADGAYDAVVIGSGDRADPLDNAGLTSNFFYMIKDRNIAVGAGADSSLNHASLADLTSNCLQEGSSATCNPDLKGGWKFGLVDGTGEKSLSTPLTFGKAIFFTTYIPPGGNEAATCGPGEGSGNLYAVNLGDATAVYNFDTADDPPNGDGEPNSPGDRSEALKSGGIPAQVVFIPPGKILKPDLTFGDTPGINRFPTFWQRVAED